MKESYYYRIADFHIKMIFADTKINGMHLLPSFAVFSEIPPSGDDLLFELLIDDNLQAIPKSQCTLVRDVDTGNGMIYVYALSDGGYQYLIKDIKGNNCALLISNKDFGKCRCALNGNYDMRSFGLNSVLMMVFAFASANKDTILVHASVVRHAGYAYPFTAKSGTGKSTHVSMWLRYIPDCDMMNDDNPIIRIMDDGTPYLYGSPWSGKTPCYRNVKAPLGAFTQIKRDDKNFVEKMGVVSALSIILPSISSMKWDVELFRRNCDTAQKLIETTPIYTVHCLPNKEAAVICQKAIAHEGKTI